MAESRRLDHVGLNVADLAAAEQWYAEAFGYVRDFVVRLDAFELDIVMLVHPDARRPAGAAAPAGVARRACGRDDPPEAVLTEGFGHIAFDVAGVDATSTGWSRSARGR